MQYKKPEIFKAIEDYINDYVDTNGTSPTVRDIAAGVGVANPTVCKYLAAMEEQGRIMYDEHRKPITRQMQNDIRNMTRTPFRNSAPIVGSIACGNPNDAEQFIEGTVRLPSSLFGEGPLYILRASGNSMIEAGIDDGDLVVIRQQTTANPGQIVVALVDDETTLKRYYPEPKKHRVRLHPENSSLKDIIVPACSVQGVAIRVIKNLE